MEKNKFYRLSFLRIPKLKVINFYLHYSLFKIVFKKYVKDNGKPDLIHAHFSEFTAYTLLKIKKKYKIPYIITEHSTDFIDGKFLSNYKKRSSSYNIIKNCFKEAKYVLCVSYYLKKKLKKIFNLKNFIFVHNFTKIKKKHYSKKYDFIFVGDLIERKNPLLLLKAFKRYFKNSSKKLAIVGDGVLFNQIKNYIDLNEINNVTIFKKINRNNVLKKISQSKIMISTSKFETFGVALIEGLSYGLKLLSTNSGGPKDIVAKSNGILLKKILQSKNWEMQ